MDISSDDAQYFPRRNSSTNTGTFAPTFTLRTRSLRTTLPAKRRLALSSSESRIVAAAIVNCSHSESNRDIRGRAVQFHIGGGVLYHYAQRGHALVLEEEGDRSRLVAFERDRSGGAVQFAA